MRQCPWCGRAIDDQAIACPYADCGRTLGHDPECMGRILPPPPPVPGSSIGEMPLASPPPPSSHAGEMPIATPPPPGSHAGEMRLQPPPPPGTHAGEMSIASPPSPGSHAGEMRLQSPPPPGLFAGEKPIASPPPPGSRAGEVSPQLDPPPGFFSREMVSQSARPGFFAAMGHRERSDRASRIPELAVRPAPSLPPGARGESLSREEAIVLSVQVEKLIHRLQLDRRRRVALATTASAFLAFVALCWTVYCVQNRMGYAELTSDVELRIDPLDPECIILTYLPVTAGRLIFRRTGAERETDFRNEVLTEDIGREQVLLWRAEGLSDGEMIGVRYRNGWRLATHELPVSQAGLPCGK